MLHNVSREIHRVYVWIYFTCQFAVLFTRYTAFLLIWRKNNKTPRISDVGDFGLYCAAGGGEFQWVYLIFPGIGGWPYVAQSWLCQLPISLWGERSWRVFFRLNACTLSGAVNTFVVCCGQNRPKIFVNQTLFRYHPDMWLLFAKIRCSGKILHLLCTKGCGRWVFWSEPERA